MNGPLADIDDEASLFVADGDVLVPTEIARGPWSPDSLHGGTVAAVVARSVEHAVGTDDGLEITRLTLELVRPVGNAPIAVTSRLVRPGRKVQLVDTVVVQEGREVAWGRSLRIRVDPSLPETTPSVPEDPVPDGPESGVLVASTRDVYRAFHTTGMEIRFVSGRFDRLGPAAAWFRLRCPVVAGEEPSPVQRAAAAADFGNGIAAELPFESNVFINPDLTVSLHRPPVGEWICVDARTRFGSPGVGAAESALWDRQGRIGRAVQQLFVEPGP
ncbi:MAG: thioesterase family protein [Acidimicrobiales bacterium]